MESHRFLIEGLDQDDVWIMVEDEFYAVAQSFTQHLHHAEYARLKREAKAQSAAAVGEMERPTDGRTTMPKELQQKKEAEALAARQKAGLEQLAAQDDNNDSDDDDDAWAGTHLHGLLTSPRESRSLAGAHAMKSSTRAAAGFGQASESKGTQSQVSLGSQSALLSKATEVHSAELDEETASSDDEDLDGYAYAVTMPPTRRVESRLPTQDAEKLTSHAKHRESGENNAFTVDKRQTSSARTSHKPTSVFKSRVQMLFDDLDELPEPSRSNTADSDHGKGPSTANQTPEAATDDNNLESKTSRYKDVPTFLL